jgi:hypothetical protein
VEPGVLQHDADPLPERSPSCLGSWPRTCTRPDVLVQWSLEDPDRRGLPRAIGARQREDLTSSEVNDRVVDGSDLAVLRGQSLHFDGGHGAHLLLHDVQGAPAPSARQGPSARARAAA